MIILQCECNYPFWIEFVYFSSGLRRPIFLDHQEARFQFFNCPECGKKIKLEELKSSKGTSNARTTQNIH